MLSTHLAAARDYNTCATSTATSTTVTAATGAPLGVYGSVGSVVRQLHLAGQQLDRT